MSEKNSNLQITSETTDEQIWLQMWCSVANAWNCKESSTAAKWADNGLKQFRERFPNPLDKP